MMAADGEGNVTSLLKDKDKAEKAAPAKKATPAKAAAKKAATPAKKAASGIVRSASTVSKEGTKKDEFTGEELPVTAFPTMKDKDGNTIRGPVARKNLEAHRAANKKARDAKKAAADKAKAEKAAKAKAEKAAEPAKA